MQQGKTGECRTPSRPVSRGSLRVLTFVADKTRQDGKRGRQDTPSPRSWLHHTLHNPVPFVAVCGLVLASWAWNSAVQGSILAHFPGDTLLFVVGKMSFLSASLCGGSIRKGSGSEAFLFHFSSYCSCRVARGLCWRCGQAAGRHPPPDS